MSKTRTVRVHYPLAVQGIGRVNEGKQTLPAEVADLLVARGQASETKPLPKEGAKEGES